MMNRRIRRVDERTNGIDQNLRVERLHQIRPSGGDDAIVRLFRNVSSDEHRALAERRVTPNCFLEDYVSGFAVPETQVEHECVHTPRRQRGMCFVAGSHGDHIETMAREEQGESLADGRLVIDDEHTGLVHTGDRRATTFRAGGGAHPGM